MKNLKKNTWEHSVFERMNVFWQNMGMRAEFLENRRFCTKYGYDGSGFFPEKSEKKSDFFFTFWPIMYCSFDRIDIFWPNICMTAGSFSWKMWKKLHKSTVFERMYVFYDKIWAWGLCVF